MLAYGIAASAARASAAPGSPARSLAAGWAGTASITASASSQAGAWADPTVSRQPPGVRASSRAIAPVLTSAPEAAATAAGRVPRPPASVVKMVASAAAAPGAGPDGGDGGISAPAASVSDAHRRDSAARPGSVASNDRASDRPA